MWIEGSLDRRLSETGKFGKEGSLEHVNPKTCAYRSTKMDKTLDNNTEQNESQKIYESMACMSYNVEITRRDF